jgi:hypothetical protein
VVQYLSWPAASYVLPLSSGFVAPISLLDCPLPNGFVTGPSHRGSTGRQLGRPGDLCRRRCLQLTLPLPRWKAGRQIRRHQEHLLQDLMVERDIYEQHRFGSLPGFRKGFRYCCTSGRSRCKSVICASRFRPRNAGGRGLCRLVD